MIGIDAEDGSLEDLVLKYNRQSLELEGKLRFSFDVHLGLPEQSPYLLVPETTAGKLNYVDKKTFEVVTEVEDLPGAHGIWWNSDASKVYLANFSSQGSESVYEVRQTTDTEEFTAEKISTHDLADAKAHNITVDFVNQVMFVTHSGPNVDGQLNRNVSLFSVKGTPTFIKTIESGSNPLGILLVDR
jgi:DNA-binding beta-propeller fold protein YncE